MTAADDVVAMLSLVPWGTNGVSLDLMRRSPQSPNGTIELMVSELCLQSEDIGISRISLNFAMFRSAFEQGAQLGAGPIARLWRGLLVFFSRWWQLETLYRSNMKYQPEWVPRYACYEDARLVPRVGVASVIAEGFLVLPFSRRNEQHTGHTSRRRRTLVATGPAAPRRQRARPRSSCSAELPDERQTPRLPEQVRVRMAKLKTLQDSGVDAYPVGQAPSHTVAQALDAADGTAVTVAGRILRIRDYGGVLFAQLRDWSGEVQLLLDNSQLETRPTRRTFTAAIDLGDLIEVTGTMGASKSGTRSLIVRSWRLIGKCLRPLPDKWKGLTDQEARVRARYVDLAINTEARDLIRARSSVLHAIRETLVGKGFLGGRDADPAADPRRRQRPAVPHPHQRLRPRPVPAHRPGALPQAAVRRRRGAGLRTGSRVPQRGRRLQPQPRVHPAGGLSGARRLQRVDRRLPRADPERGAGRQRRAGGDAARGHRRHAGTGRHLRAVAGQDRARRGVRGARRAHRPRHRPGHAAQAVRRARTSPTSPTGTPARSCSRCTSSWSRTAPRRPTFYKDFPTSVSPLTRPHRSNAGVAERWDLVAWGVELGTAYSELTDPVEQRRRLQEQSLLAAGGDPEAMELDEDFLQAMEYAMPPTGGLGMGVDRVVMLITGRSIRETLPFPLAKPR